MGYPVWALVIGSILTTVALVVVNKWVFVAGFPYVMALSTLHFMTTFLCMLALNTGGVFERKGLPLWTNLLVGGMGVASISFMNYSLKFNSVGLYQISKLCVILVILLQQIVTRGEYVSRKVFASLCLLLIGVGFATVTDVSVNMLGLIFAAAAVVSTAQYQLWQGSKQREAGLTEMQMTLSVSWAQMLIGAILTLLIESSDIAHQFAGPAAGADADADAGAGASSGGVALRGLAAKLAKTAVAKAGAAASKAAAAAAAASATPIAQVDPSVDDGGFVPAPGADAAAASASSAGSEDVSRSHLLGLIAISCLLAVSANLHSFALIGRTSAVTWQVVGHGKTLMILIAGYVMFPLPSTDVLIYNVLSVTVAVFGVVLYSSVKLNENLGDQSNDIYDRYAPAFCLNLLVPNRQHQRQQLPASEAEAEAEADARAVEMAGGKGGGAR